MKRLNKQILEAVNQGIKLALDDFDNELIGQQTQTIKDTHYTKDFQYISDNFVDLGLPSGTWWAKYNLGVEPSNLKEMKNWIGDYYAWGELNPKFDKSYWDNYTLTQRGLSDYLTKYVTDADYGGDIDGAWLVDNLTQLQPEDDIVTQSIPIKSYNFHIPTKEQFKELFKYTKFIPIQNYKGLPNINGCIFRSKNGNEIFIPVSGYIGKTGLNNNYFLKTGYLWTSTLNIEKNSQAYSIAFHSQGVTPEIFHDDRYLAFPVRGVVKL